MSGFSRTVVDARPVLCFYAFVRTTVELPQDLFRKAKSRAAARGESLKTLLTRAVAAEVDQARETKAGQRMVLPFFGDPNGPKVKLTGADLERILADEDADLINRFSRSRTG